MNINITWRADTFMRLVFEKNSLLETFDPSMAVHDFLILVLCWRNLIHAGQNDSDFSFLYPIKFKTKKI